MRDGQRLVILACGAWLWATASIGQMRFGHPADGVAYDFNRDGLGDWVESPNSPWIESSEVRSAVWVFELPALAAGQEVATADFSTLLNYRSALSANLDLYALRISVSNRVLGSDFISGTAPAGPALRTLIQPDWITPADPEGVRYALNAAAADRLGGFLRDHYQAGAYLFLAAGLRSNTPGAGQYRLNAGESDDGHAPFLQLTTRPGTTPLQSLEVVGLETDAQIKDTTGDGFGNEVLESSAAAFDVGAYSANQRLCGVFVFRLPPMPPLRQVYRADAEMGTENQDTTPGFAVDLWALRVSASSEVLPSDYGAGPTPQGPPTQRLIQAGWFGPLSDGSGRRFGTSDAGDTQLGAFLRDHYTPGHYLFLRATPDRADLSTGKYRFRTADNQWGVSPDRGYPKLTLMLELANPSGLVLQIR